MRLDHRFSSTGGYWSASGDIFVLQSFGSYIQIREMALYIYTNPTVGHGHPQAYARHMYMTASSVQLPLSFNNKCSV